jgi:hypothetical protein
VVTLRARFSDAIGYRDTPRFSGQCIAPTGCALCERVRLRALGIHLSYSRYNIAACRGNRCTYFDQIRMLRLKSSEARGPVYARGLGATLVHDEVRCEGCSG